MQTYAVRMHNFMRFGETNNSLVLDLTPEEKRDLKNGLVTMDQIYDRIMQNPFQHVQNVIKRGVERVLAIAGVIDNNYDFSNGAGKSTVLESICYSRYDKIVRKTANNPDKVNQAGLSVVTKIDGKYPKNMKESWVEEICGIGDRVYRIKRGRTFTKSHKPSDPIMEFERIYDNSVDSKMSHRTGDTKENLEDTVSMDYDLFVNSQMFGQNDAGKYLTGTDKTKKEMLISLLHLENVVSGCLENIRKKKSAQEKQTTSIKSEMDLIEKSLCAKYQLLVVGQPVSQIDTLEARQIISSIEEMHRTFNENINDVDKSIIDLSEKIVYLSTSEKISKVESIKDEGRKISKEKKAKEQSMSEQISEWEKLLSESKINKDKKALQITTLTDKNTRLQKSKDDSEKIVSQFDLKKQEEQLQRVAKAKIFKPQISENLVNARKQYEKISNTIAVLKSDKDKLKAEIDKFNRHSNDFTCAHCKSKVTKEHIASIIGQNSSDLIGITTQIENLTKDMSVETKNIEDNNSKLTKINDLISSEEGIKSNIRMFESTKTKIEDLILQIQENLDSLKSMSIEKETIESNIVDYTEKISNIKSKFSQEISDLNVLIDNLVKTLRQAEEDAKTINEQLEELKKKKKAFESEKNKFIEQIGSLGKEKTHCQELISSLNTKREEYSASIKQMNRILFLEDIYGLDGIQTRIVKKYLPLLNVYIKEFLDILSDGQMSIKMVINDKSKVDMIISGGTSETYEMLSGGEKTIVRLSVDIGLSLLSFSKTTQKPEMICLDEIFGSLDVGRTRNVFRVLNKLSDKFSRVILISHNAEINNQIKSKIIVSKSGGIMGLSEIRRIE